VIVIHKKKKLVVVGVGVVADADAALGPLTDHDDPCCQWTTNILQTATMQWKMLLTLCR